MIAPQVDPPLDEIAYKHLEQVMPGREIVSVLSNWHALVGGGLGCLTRQLPVPKKNTSQETMIIRIPKQNPNWIDSIQFIS